MAGSEQTIPSRFGAGTPSGANAPASSGIVIDLRGFVGSLVRRTGWIAGPVVAAALVGVLIASLQPRVFEARTQVLLDPRGVQVLENELVPRSSTSDAALLDADSQLRVITSAPVLSEVIKANDLRNDPDFGPAPPGLLARLLGAPATDVASPDEETRVMRALQRRVSVQRLDKTLVVEIAVRTGDGQKSARVADAIADAYIRQLADAHVRASRRASAALAGRLDELRQRVEADEKRIEAYRVRNNLIGASGRLLNEQQLSELNNELVRIRTQTAEQRARFDALRQLRLRRADPDAIAETLQSPVIAALRAQYATAKRQEAENLETYGPRHPAVASLSAQLRQIRALIDQEVERTGRSLQTEYDRAQAKQAALEASLEEMKQGASGANAALVTLRELEREAEATRGIYRTFLERKRQIEEQETVTPSNARILSPAALPAGPTGTSRLLIVGGLVALGLVAGLGLALLREQTDRRLWSAEVFAAETRLTVLGALAPPPLGSAAASVAARLLHARLREAEGTPLTILLAGTAEGPLQARLALDLARAGLAAEERLLLVDADPAGQLTRNAAAGEALTALDPVVGRRAPSPLRRLPGGAWFIGAAEPGRAPADVRASLQVYRREVDTVVIDGPPLSDPACRGLARIADVVVVTAQPGQVTAEDVAAGLALLGADRAKVAGAVLVSP